MGIRMLSIQESPPLRSVIGAFLIAPWFVVAAALVLLQGGARALADRYTPNLLAATHLVTIGFLLMTATAAMFQLLPVLSGRSVRGVSLLAPCIQGRFALGALVLAAAFWSQQARLFMGAAVLLGSTAGMFLVPTGLALWSPTTHKTILIMRYALVAFAVALGLGIIMAVSYAHGHAPAGFLSLMHPIFAFAALFILWAGVAWQVLPMFQRVQPWSYRAGLGVSLALVGLAVAALWASAAAAPPGVLAALLLGVVGVTGLSAAFILNRLGRRGRHRRDAMTYFWYLALTSLLGACFIAVPLVLGHVPSPRWPLVFGALVILGAAASFVNGMLYKIVPFLIWLNLQRQLGRTSWLMQELVPERRMMIHFAIHLLALVALLAAIVWRPGTDLAAILWACAGATLGLNLAQGALAYRRALRPLPLA